jgi:hypothetical protein
MKRILLSLGSALALMVLPAALHAQVPVVLVCHDGTTQPGSSRVACADHGGMDWAATEAWSEMRAGRFMAADTVVCTDGQNRAAAPRACAEHGGVDSVSTLAAVKRQAKARRFGDRPEATNERTSSQGATVAGGEQDTASTQSDRAGKASTKKDSTKWGYPVNRDPEVQNPPGYRGMERAVETFPPDSTPEGDSTTAQQQRPRAGSDTTATSGRATTAVDTNATSGGDTSAVDTTATTSRDTAALSDTSSAGDTTGSAVRDTAGIGGNDSTAPMDRENQ